jgi:uncharacterized protein
MTEETEPIKFQPLRKKDSRMTEENAWAALCSQEITYGFLGTHGLAAEGGMPYTVPLNFAAEPHDRAIYVHTTLDSDSKHNRSLAENSKVTFVAVHPDSAIVSSPDGVACRFTMRFTSVMAFGTAVKIEAPAEKARILNLIMEQKSGAESFMEVPEPATAITTIYRIDVQHISGARKG